MRNSSHAAIETMRRLEGIVGSAMDAIITVDATQRIILFNPAAEHMFGLSAKEALGEHISRFIPERYRAGHSAHIRQFAETGVTSRQMGALGAVSGLRANGEEFFLEASISHVGLDNETLATVILRDVTERKVNEEARLLLAREVDHRAKNALAVVQAVVSLTRAATKEEFIAAVRGRVSALARAHSLLAHNRWEGADLNQIVADETAPYQRPGQLRFTGPAIRLEPNVVQPISLLIHELATNAVKYGSLSQEHGRVDIEFAIQPDEALKLSWHEYGGPPVSPPQTKGFGSTLISEVTTRQLGGKVEIEWLPVGMRFTAILPAKVYLRETSPSRALTLQAKILPIAKEKSGRVLVVEDESLIALELCDMLASLGWIVIGPVGSVAEAMRVLDGTAPVDVALLDVNLDGSLVYPLAERLASEGVPFVFCTGYAQLDDDRFVGRPVVRKPINAAELLGEMRRATSLLAA